MLGGANLSRQGARAVPSLTYLDRHPNFSIGPDKGDDDNVIDLAQMAALGQQAARTTKTAGGSGASANIVPQGGLFWDGRADTLQDQALFPLLDPNEMDGGSAEIVADKLRRGPYVNRFVELFGAGVLRNQRLLIAEAMFAVARYQVEEPSFHPTPRRRPATACRHCSPITSTRHSVRRAMPRSRAIAIPTISTSASAARIAPTLQSRRNIAACS
jgi:cytochrome c peroxidase